MLLIIATSTFCCAFILIYFHSHILSSSGSYKIWSNWRKVISTKLCKGITIDYLKWFICCYSTIFFNRFYVFLITKPSFTFLIDVVARCYPTCYLLLHLINIFIFFVLLFLSVKKFFTFWIKIYCNALTDTFSFLEIIFHEYVLLTFTPTEISYT